MNNSVRPLDQGSSDTCHNSNESDSSRDDSDLSDGSYRMKHLQGHRLMALPTLVRRPAIGNKFVRETTELEYFDSTINNQVSGNCSNSGGVPKRKMRRLTRKDLVNDNEKSPVSG